MEYRGLEYVETSDIDVRGEEGNEVIEGYVVRFGQLSKPIMDVFREKVRKGAFERSIRQHKQKALWNHNSDYVLGNTKRRTLKLWEDDTGLRFEINPPDTQWGRDAVTSIKRGDVDGVSFGFRVQKDEWDDETDLKMPIRELIDVDLLEVSPTPFPAYPSSQIQTSVRSELLETGLDVEGIRRVIFKSQKGLRITEEERGMVDQFIDLLKSLKTDDTEDVQRSLECYNRELYLIEKGVI